MTVNHQVVGSNPTERAQQIYIVHTCTHRSIKMIEFLPVLISVIVSTAIALLLLALAFLLGRTPKEDPEKVSAYECGFDPYDDARTRFDVQFYLVSILFIIFDLEVSFLFPWSICVNTLGVFGFCTMMAFLGVLTIGFIYEWKKGALEWQ